MDPRIHQTGGCRDEDRRPFHPRSLIGNARSERAMTRGVVEMYLQAVSTRRITAIFEELSGLKITSRQVCRATAERA